MKKLLLSVFLLSGALASWADEGMWMLTDLKKQNAAVMQDMGLDIGIDQVYCPDGISLKDAVVHLVEDVPVKSSRKTVWCLLTTTVDMVTYSSTAL